MVETGAVAALGMFGLGCAVSGLTVPDVTAFEAAVLGGLQGLALALPLLLFIGAANALQPPNERGGVPFRTSLAIAMTALIPPGVITAACGFGALALPLFIPGDLVPVTMATVATITWLVSLVGLTGSGHAIATNSSRLAGIGAAVGALLVTAFMAGLTAWVLKNPFWETEQPWGFL